MRQRSPEVKRFSRIPGRGAMLAVSLGIVAIVVACGRPSTEVVPTVTRIPNPANAPIVEPTNTTAPAEDVAQVTAEAGAGTAVTEAGTVAPEAATVEAGSPVAEATEATAEDGATGGLTGDVEKGKQLAAQCLACHSVDGSTVVGPTWKGLYGREVTLEDGSTVIADDAYITQSIHDPNSQIVQGFPPAMPPFTYLSDQDIADIIAYIKSLDE